MEGPRRIFVALPDPGDRGLARRVLQSAYPQSDLVSVADALALAEALAQGPPAVLVTDLTLGWADGLELIRAVLRAAPTAVAVLFSDSVSDRLSARGFLPQVEGLVRRTSAGFLQLPEVVREALTHVSAGPSAETDGSRQEHELVSAAPVGLFAVALDGTVIRANVAFERLLGTGSDTPAVGRSVRAVFAGARPALPWEAVFHGDEALSEPDVRVQRQGEEPLSLALDLWPVRDTAGALLRLDGVVQDVSRYRGAAEPESDRATTNSDSALELEQLIYAVSHDMQEPLHVMSRNAQLLRERCGQGLDAEGQRFLGHLGASAARMQEMLDGLLACARAGREGRPLAPTDFGAAVDEALEILRASVEEAKAEVRHNALPTLPADYRQIVQLFQNLIGNAIKFRGPEPVRVVVGARERETDWRFAVKDNGIGIDPRFHARIFGMFQRLHTSEEYPGTGVGLALCKRIVQRHGGEIWVHSTPAGGSTFYFTIPKQVSTAGGEATD